MSTVVKQGAKSAEATTKAKSTRVVTPKLVCIITGSSRFTNSEYLAQKAATAGSQKRFLSHYVCSDAMKLLRELAGEKPFAGITGTTVETIREKLKVKADDVKNVPAPTIETLKVALEINGKRASKKPKVAKPAGEKKAATPRKPKAPAAPKSTPGLSKPTAPAVAETASPAAPTTPG